jgi:hypothetical protein
MRHARRSSVVLLLALLGLVLAGPFASESFADKEPLDEKAMKKKMNGWARELGVKCSYCHVAKGREMDYEAEAPNKAVAHACEERFVDRLKIEEAGKMRPVSCADCHDKKPKFLPGHAAGQAQAEPQKE